MTETATPVELDGGTWSVELEMHQAGFIRTSQTYLLRDVDGRIHVVDPGWDLGENWERLHGALAAIGARPVDVATIVATHMHIDHVGLADRLRKKTSARLVLSRVEQRAIVDFIAQRYESLESRIARWGVPAERHAELYAVVISDHCVDVKADVLVEDGDRLPIPGRDVRALVTPGHTPGSICLRDATHGLLFTGDHVLQDIVPAPGLGGETEHNPIGEFLASLERVAGFDDDLVLPGHGAPFKGVAARAQAIAEHHLRRTRDVFAVLRRNPGATVWQLTQAASWTQGFERLTGRYLLSGLGQIDTHRSFLETPPGRRWIRAQAGEKSSS
jgi:glyoxylase-like metal-dependent hydrolase (beta-lactamase superfamily II)